MVSFLFTFDDINVDKDDFMTMQLGNKLQLNT